ncbi:hypothetical protein OS493_023790 [Desmophyllum pertusum]|uniref:EGF-like domain-containing protein n=1 Tax=Desmophyllum pertusum TaxID=174260 RepID=A0A9W9YLW5_9CNID|nr:hypothetical protein OS493_023790 [Desmophyllum pertusum]
MCRCERESCCGNPFPYSTLYECFAENIAQFEDPCKDAPCKHNGYCVQLSRSAKPNFRCDCHRTGYFGPRCHERCPKDVRKEISKFSESKAKFARERRRHLLACRL